MKPTINLARLRPLLAPESPARTLFITDDGRRWLCTACGARARSLVSLRHGKGCSYEARSKAVAYLKGLLEGER